jgi:hypothetical protein
MKKLLWYIGNSVDSVTNIRKEQLMKKRLARTFWECKCHIVWVPKNRRKVVYGKLKRDIARIIRKLCEYKGIEVLEGTACVDLSRLNQCEEISVVLFTGNTVIRTSCQLYGYPTSCGWLTKRIFVISKKN